MIKQARILVACEFSGIVRNELLKMGLEAVSVDLLPTEQPGPHIQGDVTPILRQEWDMILAFPPCTRLCNSGVRWLHERNLWDDMRRSAHFFLSCLNSNAPLVAVENPTMHQYAMEICGRPDFSIQPWMFGHGEIKRTCFWTRNLPPLEATSIVSGRDNRVHRESPGPNRSKNRSRTYMGIARAMAVQWGAYVINS